MKNKVLLLILTLFIHHLLLAQSWEVVGEYDDLPEGSGYGLEEGAFTIDNNGTPYVVYADPASGYNIFIMKFENDTWQSVGNVIDNTSGTFISASLAFSSTNIPYLAYKNITSSNFNIIMVKRLENGIWENVGAGVVSSDWSGACVLALDSSDVPYVFYAEGSDSGKATVKRFENDNWQIVGQAGFSIGQISSTSIVIDNNDLPYVIYSDEGNGNSIHIKKLESGTWSEVGDETGISVTAFSSKNTLFIGGNNTPYIAYRLYETSPPYVSEIVFKKFINNEWLEVSELILEGQGISTFFELHSDMPYVAYTEGENDGGATVMRLENNVWQAIGEEDFNEGISHNIKIDTNNNGVPYVAFRDSANEHRIIVMKYDNIMNVDETTFLNNILLHPNPANDSVIISNIVTKTNIQIFDSLGKQVYSTQASQQITIDIAGFSAGIYVVKVVDAQRRQMVKKFVVSRRN